MTGVAILLDLLKRGSSPRFSASNFSGVSSAVSTASHSFGLSSAAAAAFAFAAVARPYACSYVDGDGVFPVAYCDAAPAAAWSTTPGIDRAAADLNPGTFKHSVKIYPVELKPLFSAFGFRALTMTTLRSFLLYYLPLLEPRQQPEDDDDFEDAQAQKPRVDLATPFQNSVKQIFRETSIATTRRALERIVVHYSSPRMAWKLLKDASKSARRKAARRLPAFVYIYCVGKTTFRAHSLAVAASWIVQVGIEIYRCFIRRPTIDDEDVEFSEKLRLFGKKLYSTTVKCAASLLFASIGAGIGAVFHPSNGQWIGCAIGEFVGPIATIVIFEKLNIEL